MGRDKDGKNENWKVHVARHVDEKSVLCSWATIEFPASLQDKDFGDDLDLVCNVMRFDCKGKAPSRVSARRRRTARSSSLHT